MNNTTRRQFLQSCALPAIASVCFYRQSPASENGPAQIRILEPWTIEVLYNGKTSQFKVDGPDFPCAIDEKYDSLPMFDPKGVPWGAFPCLKGVVAQNCSVWDGLQTESLKVRSASNPETIYVPQRDYRVNSWGCVGRLPGGTLGENSPVLISYSWVQMRLDSLVQNGDGTWELVRGTPHNATPLPPTLKPGQRRFANIWIPGKIDRLQDDLIFVIQEKKGSFPPRDSKIPPVAKQLLPKTWRKLESGEKLVILAWGDSVTEANYLKAEQRWQNQFVDRLRQLFPRADIRLVTEAWGGRATNSYRSEPPGSPKNYREKVLAVKPDLIISEFVNDAWMSEETVLKHYSEMLADFKEIGAEWIPCAPHYVRPDWMNLKSCMHTDEDPRPYVKGLRQFTKEHGLPLGDASRLYGRLWRRGIPYLTLMENNINHPNEVGMTLYAEALIDLFHPGGDLTQTGTHR